MRHSSLRWPRPSLMELWDTQKLRDALHVLADDPAVREAARLSHLQGLIECVDADQSPVARRRQPFWAKLRVEIDHTITTTRNRAVTLAAVAVAGQLYEGGSADETAAQAAGGSSTADEWAELVGEWCSAMEFFAESARALVLAESGPRDERPMPTIARRCRRAVAVMERVGDAYDDLAAISSQGGGLPIGRLSDMFLPASACEHAGHGWLRYYWSVYFDILAASCELVGAGVDSTDVEGWLERALLRDRAAMPSRDTGLLVAYDTAVAAARQQNVPLRRCVAFLAVRTVVETRRNAAREAVLARRRAIEPQAAAIRRKFRAASYGELNDPSKKKGLAKLFGRVDGDHSGTIDFRELASAAKRMGHCMISNEDLAVIFDEIDDDQDGLITVDEFSDWCQEAATCPVMASKAEKYGRDAKLSTVPEISESEGDQLLSNGSERAGSAALQLVDAVAPPIQLPTSAPARQLSNSASTHTHSPPELARDRGAPSNVERNRRHRDRQGAKSAKQNKKKKQIASPYGDISGAMARVDELGKQSGVGIGFGAHLLRAELIEKRIEEKKKTSEAKARAARQQRRRAGAAAREESKAIDEAWELPTETIVSASHHRRPRKSSIPPRCAGLDSVAAASPVTQQKVVPTPEHHGVIDAEARDIDELTPGVLHTMSELELSQPLKYQQRQTDREAESDTERQPQSDADKSAEGAWPRDKQPRTEILDPYTGPGIPVSPHTRQAQGSSTKAQASFAGDAANEEAVVRERVKLTAAATRIQAMQRGRAARREITATSLQAKAATRLQAAQRGCVARRGRQARVAARDERRAATRIQARVRGRMALLKYQQRETDRVAERDRARRRGARETLAATQQNEVDAAPAARQQIVAQDHAAFQRIASGGEKLSPVAQLLAKQIRQGERKVTKALRARSAVVNRRGGKDDVCKRAQGGNQASVLAAAAHAHLSLATSPDGDVVTRDVRQETRQQRARRQPVAAKDKQQAAGDTGNECDLIDSVVREVISGAVGGAMRTVLQACREKAAIRAVLSAPDIRGNRHAVDDQQGIVRGVTSVRCNGAAALRCRPTGRASGLSGAGMHLPVLVSAETQRALAYGAVPFPRRSKPAAGPRKGKQQRPAAVALPPLPAGVST